MSMSDDPRGFRRGQPGNRDYPAPQQERGGRGAPPRDDRYDGYRQPEPPPQRNERPPAEKPQQASFSAYRPEAYAAPERRGPGRQERPEWQEGPRNAPPPPAPRNAAPTSEPFPRTPPQSRDPYQQNAASDPYAPAAKRGYENDWRQDPYQDPGGNQFANYYPPQDDTPPDVQSVHNRFFAAEPEPDRAPPQPNHFRGPYDDHEYGADQTQNYTAEPAQRHHGTQSFNSGADDKNEFGWDKYDQTPPPASVRPFHPPATVPDDDLDADFFADDDDYETDDYAQDRKGGRKKLMAAVLVGAVVTGGGLAYLYKSAGGDNSGGPSFISADNRPVKEEPTASGGRDFPNKGKLIYERLAGGSDGEASSARLSSGASSGVDGAQGIVTTTGGTLEERIENALKAQKDDDPSPRGQGNSPDAPRTVRTMTFGPDGSQQPVQPKTQRIAAGAPDAMSAGIVVTSEQTASSARGIPGSDDDNAARNQQKAEARQKPPARVASIAEPRAAAPQISEAAAGSGNFFVQIAARNDQDAAMAAFASLQQKYASVLGNHSPSVRKVDLGEKGVWYRLLVGPIENKTDADQLCEQLKTAGMKGCFSRKD